MPPQPRRARLADIQARQVEVGRIRLGTTETRSKRGGGTYQSPVKLERFRLTSRSEQLVRQAAEVYGGEPEPWEPQSGGAQQWQVIIEASSIAVVVPPDSCSQYYEQWQAARCTRRCDGLRELLTEQECLCGPDPGDKKAAGCKPTTRVSLMLADLPGIGVWRLESHGYYTASELPAVVDLLSAGGGYVPARLEMEERSAQIEDPRTGKAVVSRFMVPVLHVEATPSMVVHVLGQAKPVQLPPAATPPALPAAPAQQAPPTASAAQEDQEVMKQQWTMHTWYEERIVAAPLSEMDQWAQKVREQGKLLPDFRDALLALIQGRQAEVPAPSDTAGDDPPWEPQDPSRASPPPPLPAAPVSSDASARATSWLAVNMWAGSRGMTLGKLKELYEQFNPGGSLPSSTSTDLDRFLAWLGQRP